MPEVHTFSREQVIYLSFAAGFGNIIYTFTYIAGITGRAFWLAVFIGVLLTIPLAFWIFHLGRFAPGGTIFDLLELSTGKWISRFFILVFCVINIATAVDMLNMFTGAVKAIFLRFTPAWIIMLFIMVLSVLFVGSGIQVLGRLIEILSVLAIVTFFSGYGLALIKEFKPEYVIPVFDAPFTAFAKGVLATIGMMSESLLLFMIMIRSVSHPGKHKIWVFKGLVAWAVVLSTAIFIMAGVISTDMLSRVAFAGISIAQLIQIGEFIRGLEVLILTTYQFIAVYKTSIYLYSLWVVESQLFNGKQSKFQLGLTALLIFVCSVGLNSSNQAYFFSMPLSYYVILPFSLLVMVLASLGAIIKSKKSRTVSK